MFPSVLIVDDEPSIVQSLSGLLSDEGYKVSTAFNGHDALKVIDSDSPDLVFHRNPVLCCRGDRSRHIA